MKTKIDLPDRLVVSGLEQKPKKPTIKKMVNDCFFVDFFAVLWAVGTN